MNRRTTGSAPGCRRSPARTWAARPRLGGPGRRGRRAPPRPRWRPAPRPRRAAPSPEASRAARAQRRRSCAAVEGSWPRTRRRRRPTPASSGTSPAQRRSVAEQLVEARHSRQVRAGEAVDRLPVVAHRQQTGPGGCTSAAVSRAREALASCSSSTSTRSCSGRAAPCSRCATACTSMSSKSTHPSREQRGAVLGVQPALPLHRVGVARELCRRATVTAERPVLVPRVNGRVVEVRPVLPVPRIGNVDAVQPHMDPPSAPTVAIRNAAPRPRGKRGPGASVP